MPVGPPTEWRLVINMSPGRGDTRDRLSGSEEAALDQLVAEATQLALARLVSLPVVAAFPLGHIVTLSSGTVAQPTCKFAYSIGIQAS